jgi:hypothetical protein
MSEPFDFEAFIAGAHLAEDTFALYLVNHGPQIARLQEQIAAASAPGDEREASTDSASADLEQQVETLIAQMEESKREVTLRTLTPDELRDLSGEETDVYDQLATQSVSPRLDRDQWQRLGAAVGATPFAEFVTKANALAVSRAVVPDFSPTISTSPDLRESSPN